MNHNLYGNDTLIASIFPPVSRLPSFYRNMFNFFGHGMNINPCKVVATTKPNIEKIMYCVINHYIPKSIIEIRRIRNDINFHNPPDDFLIIKVNVDIITRYPGYLSNNPIRTVVKAPYAWRYVLIKMNITSVSKNKEHTGSYLCMPTCDKDNFYRFVGQICRDRNIPMNPNQSEVCKMYYG